MSTTVTTPNNKTRRPAGSANPTSQAAGTNGHSAARPATPRGTPMLTHAQVAQRAYELFLSRNGAPGDQLSDWLQAERELRSGFQPNHD